MKSVTPQKTLVEQTYDILVDAICKGTLQPGERLAQDAIAARLGVSRQPVNAALGMLKANRLVQETGRRGLVVAGLDPALYRDIFDFRGAVEPLAVELAGRRGVSDSERRQGVAIIAAGNRALQDGNEAAMVQADVDFHSLLYRLSGNSLVESTMTVYWAHIRRAMSAILQSHEGYPRTVWAQHEQILEALVAGRTPLAVSLMREHLTAGFASLAGGRLQQVGADPGRG